MLVKKIATAVSITMLLLSGVSVCVLQADPFREVKAEGPEVVFIDASDVCASTAVSCRYSAGTVAKKTAIKNAKYSVEADNETEAAPEPEKKIPEVPVPAEDEEILVDPDWELIERGGICDTTVEEEMFDENEGEVVEEPDFDDVADVPVIEDPREVAGQPSAQSEFLGEETEIDTDPEVLDPEMSDPEDFIEAPAEDYVEIVIEAPEEDFALCADVIDFGDEILVINGFRAD